MFVCLYKRLLLVRVLRGCAADPTPTSFSRFYDTRRKIGAILWHAGTQFPLRMLINFVKLIS